MEGNNATDDDDDDGFDTEEFDSDISDESPTNELAAHTEYNAQYNAQPVVRIFSISIKIFNFFFFLCWYLILASVVF